MEGCWIAGGAPVLHHVSQEIPGKGAGFRAPARRCAGLPGRATARGEVRRRCADAPGPTSCARAPCPLSTMFCRRFLGRVLDFVRRRGAAPACQGVPQHGARCGDGVLMRRSRPRAPASPARSPSCFAGDSWERWWVAARRRDGKWLRWGAWVAVLACQSARTSGSSAWEPVFGRRLALGPGTRVPFFPQAFG